MSYIASPSRYDAMTYRKVGRSGLKLPLLSLGFWQNFGDSNPLEHQKSMVFRAFDLGITHFDFANNYGPPPGAAESNFGRILAGDLRAHRDELILSSKAGWDMWPGPYGDFGSRKYFIASCDQSLKRLGVDYVDIFYSHRMDPETPLEETMGALASLVKSGKALYVGISSYDVEHSEQAVRLLQDMGTPCLIHQPKYNMLERSVEKGLLDLLGKSGVGCIPFCPLAQGMLTGKYIHGIPVDSRMGRQPQLQGELMTPENIIKVQQLHKIAESRGQSLAQMALVWLLKDPRISSVLLGASRVSQIEDGVNALQQPGFTEDCLSEITKILG